MENRNNTNAHSNQNDSQVEAVDVAQKHNQRRKKNPSPKNQEAPKQTKTGVFIRSVKKTSIASQPVQTHVAPAQNEAISQELRPAESRTGFITLDQSQFISKLEGARARQAHTTRFAASQSGLTQFKTGGSGVLSHRSSPSVPRESYDAGLEKPPLSHQPATNSGKMTMAYMFFTSPLFYITFFVVMSLCTCSLIAYLIIAEYYAHSGGEQNGAVDSKSVAAPLMGAPNTVHFFNLSGTGRKFLFLVDTALSEETYFSGALTLIVKSQIKNSLSLLKPEDSFEILLFNTDVTPICSPSANGLAFYPATPEQLATAIEQVNQLHLKGDSDVKNAMSLALAMKPDVLFFVGQTAHLDQLTAITREELASNMDAVQFGAVEIAAGREPLTQTFLQRFARENHGQYQWLNIDDFQMASSAQERTGAANLQLSEGEQLKFKRFLERGTNDTIHQMLGSDFDERFTVDISTEESRKHSPFGRELSTSDISNTVSKNDSQEETTPPKAIALSNKLIQQIEADARIVYLSTFVSSPQNPRALRVGAESRLALWVRGAKAELPAADYLIGLCYKNGVRVQTNEGKAFQCELRAAENGCLPAMFLVSDDYFNYGIDTVSFESAKFWLERGATLGEPFAQLTWANSFANNPQDRFLWTEKAALQGLPKAQFQLGQSFEKGTGTDQDHDQAAIWFEKAAQQGFVP